MTVLDEFYHYVGAGTDDSACLARAHAILAPHFVGIAEAFYEAIDRSPNARDIMQGPEQIARLKGTLADWMSTGLLGPHDEAFWAKRSRIGRRHVQIGLPQHYMFSAMNLIRRHYHDHLLAQPQAEAHAMVAATNRVLDLELAIMLHHYQINHEERMLERERAQQADRLRALQTLTAGLAHEVRNPLNAAKLQLELLARRLRRQGVDAKLTEPTDLAHHEIARLTDLLNEFLSFARPPQLQASLCDAVVLVHNVLEIERPRADTRQLRIDVTAPPDGPLMIEADASKLHQVVQNLLRNAVDAAQGMVSVQVASSERGVAITVRDDGPGIPADVAPRIYEPFFSTKPGGTGMGMAIVHSLVTLHAGTIDFVTGTSGTAFTVDLPRRQS